MGIIRFISRYNDNQAPILFFSTPTPTGNPTGAVCPKETMIEIAQLCKKHDAWLVVDQAYEHFLHDGERYPQVW